MIGVLNYKPFQQGSILGFFDLRYHGLVVKGCRLMTGQNGLWFLFPQNEGGDGGGGTKYFDIISPMTIPPMANGYEAFRILMRILEMRHYTTACGRRPLTLTASPLRFSRDSSRETPATPN